MPKLKRSSKKAESLDKDWRRLNRRISEAKNPRLKDRLRVQRDAVSRAHNVAMEEAGIVTEYPRREKSEAVAPLLKMIEGGYDYGGREFPLGKSPYDKTPKGVPIYPRKPFPGAEKESRKISPAVMRAIRREMGR